MRTRQRLQRFEKLADWDQRRLDQLSVELGRAVRHLESAQHILHLSERELADSFVAMESSDTTSRLVWGQWSQQMKLRRDEQRQAVVLAEQQVAGARTAVEQQYRRVQSWSRLLERLRVKLRREQELMEYKISDERTTLRSLRTEREP